MHMSVVKIVMYTLSSHMFQPIMWPSVGRKNTKDECIKGYIIKVSDPIQWSMHSAWNFFVNKLESKAKA